MNIPVPPRLPKRLWIGTYEFRQEFCKPDDPRFKPENPDELHADALTETGGRLISYAEGLDLRRLFEVVCHEITHAINWVHDLEDVVLDSKEMTTADKEEEIATLHGRAWSQFYLDNPRMTSWMTRVAKQIHQEQKAA